MVMTPIAPIGTEAAGSVQEASPASFKDLMKKAVGDLNASQVEGSNAIKSLATGGAENLHDVIMSMEKAGLALQYAIQIRNKVLEAYQSVIQMQI